MLYKTSLTARDRGQFKRHLETISAKDIRSLSFITCNCAEIISYNYYGLTQSRGDTC